MIWILYSAQKEAHPSWTHDDICEELLFDGPLVWRRANRKAPWKFLAHPPNEIPCLLAGFSEDNIYRIGDPQRRNALPARREVQQLKDFLKSTKAWARTDPDMAATIWGKPDPAPLKLGRPPKPPEKKG
jgi:hypothetical protein